MTIKDIARLCGVSVSTVSRVLNDRPDVSAGVRERVLRAVKESNYIPNNSARELVRASSDNIGLVVRGVSNPFYAGIIQAVERETERAGYTMVMQQIGVNDDEVKRAAVMEREKKLRGVILLGGRSDYTQQELAMVTIPFVCCTYTNDFGQLPPESYASVSIDDIAAAESAVTRLTALGHKKIAALICETEDRSISELRYCGYARALSAAGLEPDEGLVECAHSFEMRDAYAAMKALLARRNDFTAVFAISDAMAVAAIKALGEQGRRVPEDCSVIGIDGIEVSRYITPTLTTLCQPMDELGRESVHILLDMVEGRGGGCHRRLRPTLRPGASVKAL